jgi:hypothetical protein
MNNFIYPVPSEFLLKTNHVYPPGNFEVFEEYFYRSFMDINSYSLNRVYLPIQWTSYYMSKDYGKDSMDDLQLYLDLLPRSLKYFTIIQWDDGIINDISKLDLQIFSSGGVGNIAIPLINQPYLKKSNTKDIFCSFVGAIKGRHRIREKIFDLYFDDKDFVISERVDFTMFSDIMSKSLFSLCPRGYGKTSFRICEALSVGSIPVYVYDDPWIPFEDFISFSNYGVLIKESDICNLKNILSSISDEEILNLQLNGSDVYNKYYTYDGCFHNIIKLISH